MQLKFLEFSILNETIKWWISSILKFLAWHGLMNLAEMAFLCSVAVGDHQQKTFGFLNRLCPTPSPLSLTDSCDFSIQHLYLIYISLSNSYLHYTYLYMYCLYTYTTYFILVYYTSLLYYTLIKNIYNPTSCVLHVPCFHATLLFAWQCLHSYLSRYHVFIFYFRIKTNRSRAYHV